MSTDVTKQSGYASLFISDISITKQSSYVTFTIPDLTLTKQAAYVTFYPKPPAIRRRSPIIVN